MGRRLCCRIRARLILGTVWEGTVLGLSSHDGDQFSGLTSLGYLGQGTERPDKGDCQRLSMGLEFS